jgi:glycerol-3-phosphate dehydrogenase
VSAPAGPRVVVIGAGSTGSAIAHDLALRGVPVTVFEQGGVGSGTTGHNQAQLHSGARYAVRDPESARECIEENHILRRIMPEALELNDGLFVAVREEDLAYRPIFLEACAACGIPAASIPPPRALEMEPYLNPRVLAAIRIPDGVFDPYRMCLSFLATARRHGARVYPFTRVEEIDLARGTVGVRSRADGRLRRAPADLVINAAGPWANQVAQLAGAAVSLEASAGVMVTVSGRLCNTVLNLLAPPADGDIIVPQRQTSILGTTSWTVPGPERIPIPPDAAEEIYRVAELLVPGVRQAPRLGVMAAARPLLVSPSGGRSATRGYAIYDHAGGSDGRFFSIIGGKTTTARGMAEALCDRVCARLGISAECRTRTERLLSHRSGAWETGLDGLEGAR